MERIMIGICGGTASGKSTSAEKLRELLAVKYKTAVFNCDKYYFAQKPKITAPVKGIEYDDFNTPDALDLRKIIDDISGAERDFEVIIVEGLFVLHWRELSEKLDLKIFMDCRADERIVRRLKRNLGWGLSFDEIASVYLDAVRYRHDEFVEPSRWRADIILNGSELPQKGFETICAWVDKKFTGS